MTLFSMRSIVTGMRRLSSRTTFSNLLSPDNTKSWDIAFRRCDVVSCVIRARIRRTATRSSFIRHMPDICIHRQRPGAYVDHLLHGLNTVALPKEEIVLQHTPSHVWIVPTL